MKDPRTPLADRMRPRDLSEYVGQVHLFGAGRSLRRSLEEGHLHSMILWGPPGTGKTTLARMLADDEDRILIALSAVTAGVKDVRTAMETARQEREAYGRQSVLFLDEVHRFNKAQQDAFLPFVEDGTVIFIGATTENPSFELNDALLSRARTYVLKPLTAEDLQHVLRRALEDGERGLAVDGPVPTFAGEDLERIARAADGDARRALNLLEVAAGLAVGSEDGPVVRSDDVHQVIAGGLRRFDKGGDQFYDQISALHKSVRGSDPDAALYWLCRMLDGGCDPRYIARRVTRMAAEDVGNADPRALAVCLDAWNCYERMGSPEGELAIAQAVIYLAVCAKSNAGYKAFGAAMAAAERHGSLDVPKHLKNAPTRLMKELGHGEGYRYAHDEDDAYAAGETYFPDEMRPETYYHPVPRGLEERIRAKLEELRNRDRDREREER